MKGTSTHPTPAHTPASMSLGVGLLDPLGVSLPRHHLPRQLGSVQNLGLFIGSLFSRGWEETELDKFIQAGMFWKVETGGGRVGDKNLTFHITHVCSI